VLIEPGYKIFIRKRYLSGAPEAEMQTFLLGAGVGIGFMTFMYGLNIHSNITILIGAVIVGVLSWAAAPGIKDMTKDKG
jgi:hypothetical protein